MGFLHNDSQRKCKCATEGSFIFRCAVRGPHEGFSCFFDEIHALKSLHTPAYSVSATYALKALRNSQGARQQWASQWWGVEQTDGERFLTFNMNIGPLPSVTALLDRLQEVGDRPGR